MAAGENQLGRQKKLDARKLSKTATSPPSTARFVERTGGAGGGVMSVPWTGVDGHSTMGLVGAFFGTCRPTKQARSPSDSGIIANNDNNILTNDKSCGTVEQSISTTVGFV